MLSSSPYQRMRYSQAPMVTPASRMSCSFSAAVSWMMESSNCMRVSPSLGMDSPKPRDACMTALAMETIAPSRLFSCLLMFRMSAELSLDTSVAVFTYPRDSFMSK